VLSLVAWHPVQRWHLPSIEANGRREPRVLFSRPECRAVLIDLNAGDEMGDHRTHEQAVLEVVSGRVAVTTADRRVECEAGTLVSLDPGETRSVQALEAARLLLILAPWPGEGHFMRGEIPDPLRMPAQAAVPPLDS
jgi:quercetin dioxygenase-like cupin family protein